MDWKQFGLTLNHVFRYGFGGLLLFGIAAVLWPDYTQTRIAALGEVLAPLVAFSLGGAIYTLYRLLLGDWLIYWLVVSVHALLDSCCAHWTQDDVTCKLRYLSLHYKLNENWNLGWKKGCRTIAWPFLWPFLARRAFRVLRDNGAAFDEENRKRFELTHSEYHLVYISAFLLLIFALHQWWIVGTLTWVFALSSLALFLLGISADIILSRRECDELRVTRTAQLPKKEEQEVTYEAKRHRLLEDGRFIVKVSQNDP